MGRTDGCSLAEKYEDFQKPVARVFAGGREISLKKGIYLESVDVTSSAGKDPDMAELVYRVDKLPAEQWKGFEKYLDVGQKIEIRAGYGTEDTRIFLGYLHETEVCDWMQEYVEYTLLCLDVKGLMKKNSVFQASGTLKIQQLLDEILDTGSYRDLIEKKEVDRLPKSMDQDCVIKGQTHYDWLCSLAEYLDYDFFCGRGSLVFRQAGKSDELLQLSGRCGLQAVRTRVSMTGQTGTVQVSGYNRKDAKLAASAGWPGAAGPFGGRMAQAVQGLALSFWDMGLETGEQATLKAQAFMSRAARQYSRMEAVSIGLPEIAPGTCVEFTDDTIASLKGTIYVDEARHVLDSGGYKTVFKGSRTKG